MKKQTQNGATLPSSDLLCSSIPVMLPNGKRNPAYDRWYRAKRKAEGNPVKVPWNAARAKWKQEWRQTAAGKAATKRWNESEAGKAAIAKYRSSPKGRRQSQETGDEYASRIIRELEAISRHNVEPVPESVIHW